MELDLTLDYIQKDYRSGVSSIKTQALRTMYTGLTLQKFSPFYEILNEEIGPQVLTTDHLRIGFIFCIVLVSFAIVAFVAEIAIPGMKKFFRNRC